MLAYASDLQLECRAARQPTPHQPMQLNNLRATP